MLRKNVLPFLPILSVCFSLALSLYWAWLVPIFQSPDEDLHADYVFCLYSHKGLMFGNEGVRTNPAHSYTKYLLDATNSLIVRWHEFEKMPEGYGSKNFFQQLNSNAPTAKIYGVPSLVSRYPFGYYALSAFWLNLVGLFASSITSLFFAARIFSVFLFIVGMIYSYFTIRELGISYRLSSLLTAAIGLLPLSSFSGSYIQPNNLAFAAVSICFFLALRWRNRNDSRLLSYLGMALALLFLAKYQFYFCVSMAVIAMVLAKNYVYAASLKKHLFDLGKVLAPSVLATLIQGWVSGAFWFYPIYLNETKSAMHWGLFSLGKQFLDSIVSTFYSLYGTDGYCFKTFWRCFGWIDTPAIIITPKFTFFLTAIIHWLSLFMASLVILGLIKIATILFRLGKKDHWRLFLYVIFRDPLITSFLVYFVLVFVLAFFSYGNFSLQGRHWFPLILPLFWTTINLAVRLAKRDWRQKIFVLFFAALLSYSFIGNYYAIKSIHKRYYEKPAWVDLKSMQTVSEWASCDIEIAGYVNPVGSLEKNFSTFIIPATVPLIIQGWAIDLSHHKPASAVLIYIDEDKPIPAVYGLESPQAADAMLDEAYRYSGFGLVIPTKNFSSGWHTLNVKVVSNNKRLLYRTKKTLKFRLRDQH